MEILCGTSTTMCCTFTGMDVDSASPLIYSNLAPPSTWKQEDPFSCTTPHPPPPSSSPCYIPRSLSTNQPIHHVSILFLFTVSSLGEKERGHHVFWNEEETQTIGEIEIWRYTSWFFYRYLQMGYDEERTNNTSSTSIRVHLGFLTMVFCHLDVLRYLDKAKPIRVFLESSHNRQVLPPLTLKDVDRKAVV